MNTFPPHRGPLTDQEAAILRECFADPDKMNSVERAALKRAIGRPRNTPLDILAIYVGELERAKADAMYRAYTMARQPGIVFPHCAPPLLRGFLGATLMERLAAACDRAPIIHGSFTAN